jgi:hypothetical protein
MTQMSGPVRHSIRTFIIAVGLYKETALFGNIISGAHGFVFTTHGAFIIIQTIEIGWA